MVAGPRDTGHETRDSGHKDTHSRSQWSKSEKRFAAASIYMSACAWVCVCVCVSAVNRKQPGNNINMRLLQKQRCQRQHSSGSSSSASGWQLFASGSWFSRKAEVLKRWKTEDGSHQRDFTLNFIFAALLDPVLKNNKESTKYIKKRFCLVYTF